MPSCQKIIFVYTDCQVCSKICYFYSKYDRPKWEVYIRSDKITSYVDNSMNNSRWAFHWSTFFYFKCIIVLITEDGAILQCTVYIVTVSKATTYIDYFVLFD